MAARTSRSRERWRARVVGILTEADFVELARKFLEWDARSSPPI